MRNLPHYQQQQQHQQQPEKKITVTSLERM